MSKEWEKDPEFSDLTPEAILEYREFMEQMFDVIRRNKSQFLRDPSFSTGFKIERIE